MELKDTVDLMLSKDYKERFKAEYHQLSYRLRKLSEMLDKWDANELGFTPTCARATYELQKQLMGGYLDILSSRAAVEGITLSK